MAEAEKKQNWEDITQDGDAPGGLLKQVLVQGQSPYGPTKDAAIKVHYNGILTASQKKFDSSIDREEYYKFTLSERKVIKGWAVGIPTMRFGEKCLIRCRKDYAYGDESPPGSDIPEGSSLDFEVELYTNYEKVNALEGIQKLSIGGEFQMKTAKDEAKINIDFAVCDQWGNSKGIERKNTSLEVLEEDTFSDFPEWVHKCFMTMGESQHMIFSVSSDEYERPEWWKIPEADSIFYFRVKINSLENRKELWQMEVEEKFAESLRRKEVGNTFFKQKVFTKAKKHYSKGLEILEADIKQASGRDNKKTTEEIIEEFPSEFWDLYCGLASNLSMTYIKQKIYDDGRDAASKALKYRSKNMKALARRAQCLVQTGDPFGAREDLAIVLKMDPGNKYCENLDKIAKQRVKAYEKKKKKMAAKMFG